MTLELLVFWGLVGWCGTPPRPPWPPWPPIPLPRWLLGRVVGAVAGVVGGWLFNQAWPVGEAQMATGLAVAASGVGALIGAIFITDLLGRVSGSPQPEPPT